jgi:hypothetical protein
MSSIPACINNENCKRTSVSIIISAHRTSETEYNSGNCKFNEEGMGPKIVFVYNVGLCLGQSSSTSVILLKYNEGIGH